MPPRERRLVAGRKKTTPEQQSIKQDRQGVFLRHLGGAQGGSVCAGPAGRAGGRNEREAGGPGVRPVAQDDPEDAGVLGAAWLSAEEAGLTPEIGSLAGSRGPDSGERRVAAEETTAHGAADLRPAQRGTRLHWRLHDRQGLRPGCAIAAQGSV